MANVIPELVEQARQLQLQLQQLDRQRDEIIRNLEAVQRVMELMGASKGLTVPIETGDSPSTTSRWNGVRLMDAAEQLLAENPAWQLLDRKGQVRRITDQLTFDGFEFSSKAELGVNMALNQLTKRRAKEQEQVDRRENEDDGPPLEA